MDGKYYHDYCYPGEDVNESTGPNLKKLKAEAYEYFSRAKISPTPEEIVDYVADAIEDESGADMDQAGYLALAKKLGMTIDESKSKKLKEEKGMEKDIETMYTTVLEAVPELKDFDPEEVKKGLGDEQEHKDILSQDEKEQVIQVGKIVLAHLKECPKYYAVLDAALEQFKSEGVDDKVEHEAGETAAEEEAEHKAGGEEEEKKLPISEPVGESIKAIRKAKISEAIIREEKTEQIEKLQEAFNKIEENYINDVFELTEKVRLAEESKKPSKEDEEKFMKLEKEFTDLLAVSKKFQEENDEFNKKIGGLESNIADKDLELKKVKESCENQLKEMRVQIVAKITGLTLDEKMVGLLKECKTDDELLQKLEGYRTKLAEAVLHSNIVKKVEIVQPLPEQNAKQAGLDRFGRMVESMM
jgi:hypothetical protein